MSRPLPRSWCLGLSVLGLLASCRTTSSRPDRPALRTSLTAQSREELQRTVSAALGGGPDALVADDALMSQSTLIVERARPRDPSGRLIDGRDLRRPERFELVESDGACVLIRVRTWERFPLPATTCAPVPAAP